MQVLKLVIFLSGGIAQGFDKEIPTDIIYKARNMLPEEFFLTIIDEFNRVYSASLSLLISNGATSRHLAHDRTLARREK